MLFFFGTKFFLMRPLHDVDDGLFSFLSFFFLVSPPKRFRGASASRGVASEVVSKGSAEPTGFRLRYSKKALR
jgi:hypothetical protein